MIVSSEGWGSAVSFSAWSSLTSGSDTSSSDVSSSDTTSSWVVVSSSFPSAGSSVAISSGGWGSSDTSSASGSVTIGSSGGGPKSSCSLVRKNTRSIIITRAIIPITIFLFELDELSAMLYFFIPFGALHTFCKIILPDLITPFKR